ncbi:hypothetical protein Q1695_012891 [Nippostrongylus brasiliensis]|nr:hypothetical protein Q1695_012891 [Nippostrongylus brasiliensis]
MAGADAVENPGTLRFCTLCRRQIAGEETADVDVVQNSYECVLCFGLLDQDFIQKVADAVAAQLKDTPYDATACTLALNLPISQTLREVIVRKSRPDLNGILIAVPYKIRNIDAYLPKLREATGLRLTLSSDLRLTVAFENDEFCQYDTQFLKEHFPENFLQGKKRKFGQDEPLAWTKIKVEQILGRIREDIARKYSLSSPTRPCTFSISFERDPVYVAGRYCKYSRSLPQSPWSVEDKAAPKEPGNSVSEKVCDPMAKMFGASDTRFIASGREDLDVRMLGDGRPFAVELRNCRFTNSLKGEECENTLRRLEEEINAQRDIKVKYLTRITREEAESLSVGEEEKRKHYTAYCYSTLPISDEALASAMKSAPVELIQRTPVRVLKRRALLDRPRTVYTLEILRMDSHHFLMRLETQAGTYVKEFVHGDFGRTRPSLADLLNVSNGEIDILDLDVEKVDFDWPPNSTGKSFS